MILFIHGISQQSFIKNPEKLHEKWLSILREGLRKQGADEAYTQRITHNSKLLFYADITDPDRVVVPERTRAASIEQYERLIRTQIKYAKNKRGLQNSRVAHNLAKWMDTHPRLGRVVIRLFAREAYGYFGNPAAAAELDLRCDQFTKDRYEMIISHSFGTVVAYRLLSRYGGCCRNLLTLGSPLGAPFMRQGLNAQTTAVFEQVETWTDFKDPLDIVSYADLDLRDLFSNYSKPPPIFIQNHAVANFTNNHHSIQGYLGEAGVIQRVMELIK